MKKASLPEGVASTNIESLGECPEEIRKTQPPSFSQLPTPWGSHS